jgi:two-component system sensor histidine kinase VicK
MFFRTIQWRLIFILSLITFVLMTVVWVFLNFQVERSFYDSFKDDIARNYDSLGIKETATVDSLRKRLTTDAVITGLILGEYKSFTILDKATGDILYSSDPVYQDAARQTLFRTAIYKSVNLIAVLDGEAEGLRPVHTRTNIQGLGDFYDYVRVQPLQERDVVLFFKYSRTKALGVLDKFNGMILTSILLALVAALGLGLAFSRTITRPITDIMHKAESITAGEFGQLLEVKSMDEIGKLTATFNFMSTRLKNMIMEIAAEKNKVETVINHMSDGVLAFDRNGMAIHINHAAVAMLGTLAGRRGGRLSDKNIRFGKLMQALGVDVTLESVLQQEPSPLKPVIVPVMERFLRLQFAVFSDESGQPGGVIIVFQDITEEHRLENMRREFVANVSHELRTPLTSVKSYTETLLDGAMEDSEITERFLKVINEETDRMVRLVKDLLLLSQHDSGLKLTMDPIDPEELVNACIERLRHQAADKRQNLFCERMEGLPNPLIILGDRDRLEQLLLNIVGNAVKYTPAGGQIRIVLARQEGKLAIRVHDTGIGIPEKDLSRIFERFYRVDKARSRQMGGTGLGLAIAKEIALLHGGSIHAQSRINEGSVITVLLPISDFVKGQQEVNGL